MKVNKKITQKDDYLVIAVVQKTELMVHFRSIKLGPWKP